MSTRINIFCLAMAALMVLLQTGTAHESTRPGSLSKGAFARRQQTHTRLHPRLDRGFWDQRCAKKRTRIAVLTSCIHIVPLADVLLICPQSHRAAISHHIHSSAFPSLSVDLQTYDDAAQANAGTAGILKHFAHRIPKDFVLLPCDLIPPANVPLRTLLNRYRTSTVTDGSLAVSFWFRQPPPPDPKAESWDQSTSATTTTIICDEGSSTLLHVDTSNDRDRNPDEMDLRMGLLSR